MERPARGARDSRLPRRGRRIDSSTRTGRTPTSTEPRKRAHSRVRMEARRTTRIDCLATDHDNHTDLDRGGPSHGRCSKGLSDSTSLRYPGPERVVSTNRARKVHKLRRHLTRRGRRGCGKQDGDYSADSRGMRARDTRSPPLRCQSADITPVAPKNVVQLRQGARAPHSSRVARHARSLWMELSRGPARPDLALYAARE